jgi:hypothetical protein
VIDEAKEGKPEPEAERVSTYNTLLRAMRHEIIGVIGEKV